MDEKAREEVDVLRNLHEMQPELPIMMRPDKLKAVFTVIGEQEAEIERLRRVIVQEIVSESEKMGLYGPETKDYYGRDDDRSRS